MYYFFNTYVLVTGETSESDIVKLILTFITICDEWSCRFDVTLLIKETYKEF